MRNERVYTKEQLLYKFTSLCAKSEYCIFDIRNKMVRLGVDNDIQEEVINYLVNERFIDETRFARLFIRNKSKYNKWGVQKIRQAFYAKHISPEIFEPLFDETEEIDYEDTLIGLLKNKIKNIKASNEYEKKGKLVRFALQRGFSMEQALKCSEFVIKNVDTEDS